MIYTTTANTNKSIKFPFIQSVNFSCDFIQNISIACKIKLDKLYINMIRQKQSNIQIGITDKHTMFQKLYVSLNSLWGTINSQRLFGFIKLKYIPQTIDIRQPLQLNPFVYKKPIDNKGLKSITVSGIQYQLPQSLQISTLRDLRSYIQENKLHISLNSQLTQRYTESNIVSLSSIQTINNHNVQKLVIQVNSPLTAQWGNKDMFPTIYIGTNDKCVTCQEQMNV